MRVRMEDRRRGGAEVPGGAKACRDCMLKGRGWWWQRKDASGIRTRVEQKERCDRAGRVFEGDSIGHERAEENKEMQLQAMKCNCGK